MVQYYCIASCISEWVSAIRYQGFFKSLIVVYRLLPSQRMRFSVRASSDLIIDETLILLFANMAMITSKMEVQAHRLSLNNYESVVTTLRHVDSKRSVTDHAVNEIDVCDDVSRIAFEQHDTLRSVS